MALSATCLFESLDEIRPYVLRSSVMAAPSHEDDAVIERLANAITEEIEAATGRMFMTRAVTERRVWDGRTSLRLLRWPVAVSPAPVLTVADDVIDVADYIVYTADGVLAWPDLTFAAGDDIVIAYTAGYARASLPARVIQLALDMVLIRFQVWKSGGSGVTSMNQGQVSMVPLPDWPYAIKNTLESLKRESNP